MVPGEHRPRQGAIAFIHAFVVRTAQSYVTAVPSGAAKSLERAGALESALGARVDQVRSSTWTTVTVNSTAYGIFERQVCS